MRIYLNPDPVSGVNNKKFGGSKVYDEDGNLIKTEYYDDDILRE